MSSYAQGNRPPVKRTANGSKWRKVVKAVIAQHGTICVLCGHGGAESADHTLSVRERPDLEWEFSNLRPCHFKPCTICTTAARSLDPESKPIRCQYVKGYGSLETARRILHERTGLPVPGYTPADTPEDNQSWW